MGSGTVLHSSAIAHGDVLEGLTNNSGRSRELVERLGKSEGIILHNVLILGTYTILCIDDTPSYTREDCEDSE
jgi:hypothetical protein